MNSDMKPARAGMNKMLSFAALSVLGMFACVGIRAYQDIMAGNNAMPAINVCASCILLFAWTIANKTTWGKSWVSDGMVSFSVVGIIILLCGLIKPSALIGGHAWCNINLAAVGCSIPLLVIATIRYFYRPGTMVGCHKVRLFTFVLTWLVTIHVIGHVATASEAQLTGAAISQAGHLTTNGVPVMSPDLYFCLGILVVVAIILGVIILVCRAAHLCGNTSTPPPTSTGPSAAVARASASVFTTAYTTPMTKTATANASVDTDPITADEMRLQGILSTIITTDTMAIWTNTSGIHDPNYDTAYAYTKTYNYSVIGTTDLSNTNSWHTLWTVVQWQTGDPRNPLICEVDYTNCVTAASTNGVAVSTNWTQFFTDQYLQVTNTVTYGGRHHLPIDMKAVKQMFLKTYADLSKVSTVGP